MPRAVSEVNMLDLFKTPLVSPFHNSIERIATYSSRTVVFKRAASNIESKKPKEGSVWRLVSFLAKIGDEWPAGSIGSGLHNRKSLADSQRTNRRTYQGLAALASAITTQGSGEDNGCPKKFLWFYSRAIISIANALLTDHWLCTQWLE